MSRSLKHYLNDKCASVLRNFPFPIRQKVKQFPSISCKGQSGVVAVLCSPGQFMEGLWSLWSWMNQLNSLMGAVLLFDGKATQEQQTLFQKIFPAGKFLELAPFLKSRSLPGYFQRFIETNWTGKKLAAVFELQKEFNVLYSDCDVLAFDKPDEIVASISGGTSAYLFDPIGYHLDPWLSRRAEKLDIPITKHFNAGLVYIPRDEMKKSQLEALISDWEPSFNSHHAEQTLFSILLNSRHLRPMPEKKYVLSWQGVWVLEKDLDCNSIICRHYVGPVRHRMYLSGYPFLLAKIQQILS
jgi:hypothetical protein